MTVTTGAPVVAPQPPTTDPTIPALLHDEGGWFRTVNGRRIPANERGIAVLDGTAAEVAYDAAQALDKSIKALVRQYDAQVEIIKTAVGEKKVATLRGRKVITWGWSTRRSLDPTLAEAILTPEQYETVKQETPSRSFEPAYRK